MSSRKALPLKLSRKAEQDIVDILAYTAKTWGEPQFEIYLEKIEKALAAIGENFELGHPVAISRRHTWRTWSARTSSYIGHCRTTPMPRASASYASCISA